LRGEAAPKAASPRALVTGQAEIGLAARLIATFQNFEKGGSYYSVREERQKFLLDHAHFQ